MSYHLAIYLTHSYIYDYASCFQPFTIMNGIKIQRHTQIWDISFRLLHAVSHKYDTSAPEGTDGLQAFETVISLGIRDMVFQQLTYPFGGVKSSSLPPVFNIPTSSWSLLGYKGARGNTNQI